MSEAQRKGKKERNTDSLSFFAPPPELLIHTLQCINKKTFAVVVSYSFCRVILCTHIAQEGY